MKHNPISPDDPRLTAYALNEMAPAERAAFEQILAQDDAARQAVDEIAATSALLTGALEHEAMQPVAKPTPRHDTYAKVILFPYWKISGLAAACFAMFFIYWQRNEIAREQKQYIEVPLTAAPEKPEEPPAPAAIAVLEADTMAVEQAKHDEIQATARLAKQAQESSAREQLIAARNEAIESATKKTSVAAAPMPVPASVEARSAASSPTDTGKAKLEDEETVVLSPFQVTAPEQRGYAASSTLAGSRARAPAGRKDLATAASVAMGDVSAAGVSTGDTTEFRQDDGYVRTSDQPLSGIGTKVATTSYAEVRRLLNEGKRPPVEAVRVEELVNHFVYNYAPPAGREPFSANLEVAGAPWAPTHRLVRIGLKAREPGPAAPGRNLTDRSGDSLVTIAKAVTIQVEFNPATVQAYRLIGYERRRPAQENSSRAQMDLGGDGLEHALTALYEVVPVGVEMPDTDKALKYERPENLRASIQSPGSKEMLTVKIRYKEPAGGANRRLEFPLRDAGAAFERASEDFKFAAAVASFGMVLRDSPFKGAATMTAVAGWARAGLGHDADGQRREFLGLIERARQVPQ